MRLLQVQMKPLHFKYNNEIIIMVYTLLSSYHESNVLFSFRSDH